jgi:hypothetical protein
MNRTFTAVAAAALLATILPAAVSAAGVTKYVNHAVTVFCDAPFDGGFASVVADSTTAFGDGGEVSVWLDPAIPFESDPTSFGSLDTIAVVESSTEVTVTATFVLFDADGVEVGPAGLSATLEPDGDPIPLERPDPSNHHYATTGSTQQFVGTGTLTLQDATVAMPCAGDITDVDVHEANPTSTVSNDAGLVLDCFWPVGEGFAFLSVRDNVFGFSADAFLFTPDLSLGSQQSSGSIDPAGVSVTFELLDFVSGNPYTATATADFTPVGTPVTSRAVQRATTEKRVEQSLAPDGTLQFTPGDGFPIDDEHCNASQFSSHTVRTSPGGPKPGAALPNDTPEGAIALEPGARFNVQIGGEALEAEEPTNTCPEGRNDRMGHTVWYTIEGTGGPITFDTAGSNFDTVLAVYVREGDGFTELACVDDVFYEPIGISLQAAITGDTELGVTYYVQVGGFQNFRSLVTEFGRLRVRVS